MKLRYRLATNKTLLAEIERLLNEVDRWQKLTRFWQKSYRELETKPPSTAKGAK